MEMNSFTISFLMIIQTIHIFEKHSTVTRRAKEYGIDIQARETPGRSDKDIPKRSRFRSAGNRMGEDSLNFSLKFALIEGRLLNLPRVRRMDQKRARVF